MHQFGRMEKVDAAQDIVENRFDVLIRELWRQIGLNDILEIVIALLQNKEVMVQNALGSMCIVWQDDIQ